MKMFSWNVNGVRACAKKGFLRWFHEQRPDILCLQETKAREDQLDEELLHPLGYHSYWRSAEKAGYSGVAIYSKKEPLDVRSMGIRKFDREGRVLLAEYSDFVVISAYFPNSGREHDRLPYKLDFCKAMLKFCNDLRAEGKNVVLCGDYNIAHREIDIRNPKSNVKTAGFLPKERAWMDVFIDENGWVDIFRERVKDPHHYTWWSYRPTVRERNIGWRIDYHCINDGLRDRVKDVGHQPQVKGSDHCPVFLQLKA